MTRCSKEVRHFGNVNEQLLIDFNNIARMSLFKRFRKKDHQYYYLYSRLSLRYAQ